MISQYPVIFFFLHKIKCKEKKLNMNCNFLNVIKVLAEQLNLTALQVALTCLRNEPI